VGCLIAVPTHNCSDLLCALLTSLGATKDNIEVVVYDDGNDETGRRITETQWPFKVHLIKSRRRVGVVKARAELMKWAHKKFKGNWFCFIDSDVEVIDPLWLVKLKEWHIDGITTTKLMLPDGHVWSAGGCWEEANNPWGWKATLRGYHEPDRPEYNIPMQIPHCPTAAALMRMDLLHRGLIIDTSGGNLRTCEDSDLCMQAQFDYTEGCWYWPVEFLHNSFSYRPHSSKEMQQHTAEVNGGEAFFWNKWQGQIKERWHLSSSEGV